MTRWINGLLVILLISPAFSGCASKKAEETDPGVTSNEILIGSTSALSGKTGFLGTQYTHGSLAYINEINERQGVWGRKIKLITYDDQYDPPQTVANTQRLISEDKVFCLFDYVGTPTSLKVVDLVHQAHVPLLGLLTGAESLRTPFRPYFFHVRDSYYDEAEGLIAYFVDKLGLKNIAVMYQNDAFGLAVLTGVQLALQRRNMDTVATATYERSTMAVEAAEKEIKTSGADAVILVGTYSPLAKFIELCHTDDFAPYFGTVSFVGSEAFASELMQAQNVDSQYYHKIIVTQVMPSPFTKDLPAVSEYLNLSKKYFPKDKPNYVALEGFINAKVLVTALQNNGPALTRDSFISTLEHFNKLDLGIGKILTYDTLDHNGIKGVYYSRLTEKGVFDIFDPEKE